MLTSHLFRRKTVAFHLIGQQANALKALYDITEYLYIDDVSYTITDNKPSFYREAALVKHDVILHISNLCDYGEMAELTRKAREVSDGRLEVCNLLVFPKPHIREDVHKKVYVCKDTSGSGRFGKDAFLGMYYLDEKYSEKYLYVKNIMEYLHNHTKHI